MPTSPKYLHYKVSLRCSEGTLHVRIYTIHEMTDTFGVVDPSWGGKPRSLNMHAKWLFGGVYTSNEIEIDPLDVISIGSSQVSADGELLQGIPKIKQVGIELRSRRYLMPLIDAIRDPAIQTWMEVTIEHAARDISPRNDGPSFIYPRKTRSYFWGMLDRNSALEKVKQQALTKGFVNRLTRRPIEHDGTLSLSFMSWAKARGSQAAKDFLDNYKAKRVPGLAPAFPPLSEFLNELLSHFSPTDLFFATDNRLLGPKDSSQAPYGLDILLPYEIGRGGVWTNRLAEFLLRYWIVDGEPKHSIFFYNGTEGSSPNSFYRWKDLAQGLFEICLDLLLYPQWEIPTLEEIRTVPPNLANTNYNHVNYWQGVTRFLLLPYIDPPLKLYADIDEETIEIGHAATWARSYKVEQPTVQNLLPAPAYAIVQRGTEGGAEQSYKSLFRLVGQEYQDNVLVDTERGFEIYMLGGAPAKEVRANGKIFTSWAAFHATYKMDLWGGVRSTLSCESQYAAVEPFGQGLIDNDIAVDQPVRTFGFQDYGEFPLLRVFEFRGGLIVNNEEDLIKYFLIDIDRIPGMEGQPSKAKLKFLELKQFTPEISGGILDNGPIPPPPDDPEDPDDPRDPEDPREPPEVTIVQPPDLGPPIVAGTTIRVTATDATGISLVKMYIDNVLIDVAAHSYEGDEYRFSWDSTTVADGSHVLKIVAADLWGNSASDSVTITVDNDPMS